MKIEKQAKLYSKHSGTFFSSFHNDSGDSLEKKYLIQECYFVLHRMQESNVLYKADKNVPTYKKIELSFPWRTFLKEASNKKKWAAEEAVRYQMAFYELFSSFYLSPDGYNYRFVPYAKISIEHEGRFLDFRCFNSVEQIPFEATINVCFLTQGLDPFLTKEMRPFEEPFKQYYYFPVNVVEAFPGNRKLGVGLSNFLSFVCAEVIVCFPYTPSTYTIGYRHLEKLLGYKATASKTIVKQRLAKINEFLGKQNWLTLAAVPFPDDNTRWPALDRLQVICSLNPAVFSKGKLSFVRNKPEVLRGLLDQGKKINLYGTCEGIQAQLIKLGPYSIKGFGDCEMVRTIFTGYNSLITKYCEGINSKFVSLVPEVEHIYKTSIGLHQDKIRKQTAKKSGYYDTKRILTSFGPKGYQLKDSYPRHEEIVVNNFSFVGMAKELKPIFYSGLGKAFDLDVWNVDLSTAHFNIGKTLCSSFLEESSPGISMLDNLVLENVDWQDLVTRCPVPFQKKDLKRHALAILNSRKIDSIQIFREMDFEKPPSYLELKKLKEIWAEYAKAEPIFEACETVFETLLKNTTVLTFSEETLVSFCKRNRLAKRKGVSRVYVGVETLVMVALFVDIHLDPEMFVYSHEKDGVIFFAEKNKKQKSFSFPTFERVSKALIGQVLPFKIEKFTP
jgi:hypothetical protein